MTSLRMFLKLLSNLSSSFMGRLNTKGMLKGSSMMFPTSSIESKAQVTVITQGIILQPNASTSTSGKVKHQTLRNRLVWRLYDRGTVVLTMRSAEPTASVRPARECSACCLSVIRSAAKTAECSRLTPLPFSSYFKCLAMPLLLVYALRRMAPSILITTYGLFLEDQTISTSDSERRPFRASFWLETPLPPVRRCCRRIGGNAPMSCRKCSRSHPVIELWVTRASSRNLLIIPPQIFRASQYRSYAELVRNTNISPRAPLMRPWEEGLSPFVIRPIWTGYLFCISQTTTQRMLLAIR
mmetsp:Transcript_7873/g.19141  ORF Transcript_7873/g.19141 Transcript_7873/m.19141 type:complete len:297 (-) Transcript_7873:584-1474(-)